MDVRLIRRERRHTLYFLGDLRRFSAVHLDTEVDMGAVLRHRATAAHAGRRYSVVSYVLHAGGRTLAAHPEANAAIGGRLRQKIARFTSVSGKLTLDRTLSGQRVVLAAVLPGLEQATLDEIQAVVDQYRDGDPETMPQFAGTRALHRLPAPVARAAYRRASSPLARRAAVRGTFSVTSLGHRPVDGFHSVGGTTITLGVGQIAERPVVRGGAVTTAPLLRLSLTFDHRVIDGAEAADVLADLRTALETFGAAEDGDTDATGASNGVPDDALEGLPR
ncbi:acyltransferase [Parafrankia colletiae]|uniref:Acyltransferase n=1 Tax=Parafrankia colletiae TaxID=573497 RepID=A0A1S1QVI9_9ACTN|nr:acyltransferase [Parafrankia colletiae]